MRPDADYRVQRHTLRRRCMKHGHNWRSVPSVSDPSLPLQVCRRWLCRAWRYAT